MQRKLLQQLPLLYRRADWKLELEPLCGKSSEEALHVVLLFCSNSERNMHHCKILATAWCHVLQAKQTACWLLT